MSSRPNLTTLALAGGWIIRAIEEYGVGGDHKPDTETFLLAGSAVATDIGQALIDAGLAPAGTATEAIRHVIGKHLEEVAAKPPARSAPS